MRNTGQVEVGKGASWGRLALSRVISRDLSFLQLTLSPFLDFRFLHADTPRCHRDRNHRDHCKPSNKHI